MPVVRRRQASVFCGKKQWAGDALQFVCRDLRIARQRGSCAYRGFVVTVYLPIAELSVNIFIILGMGAAVGFLSGMFGVGGGFIMVPAMIYLLRIPTNVVVGTSLFQIIFVTAFTTIVQAATNYSVDIVLAFILMVAGVIGAQYGVRVGQRLRGEQLRALLGLLVLAVGLRLAVDLVATPSDIYSVVTESFAR